MANILGAVMLVWLFAGCSFLSTAPSPVIDTNSPLYKYKADITIEVNDVKYDGVVALPLARTQTIKIVSKAKLDLLIVSSCQRFVTHEKLDKSWFGGAGKDYKYEYTPTQFEFDEKCPLYFQAFETKAGLAAWGYVAFKTNETLNAVVECNGKTYNSPGVTMCQTKNGFEQVISFAVPVKYKAGESCTVTKITEQKFKVIPGIGFCNIAFNDGKNNIHSLTLLGYEQAFVRGE